MCQRTRFFLVVLLLMFAGNIFAQSNSNSNEYSYAKKDIKIFSAGDSLLPPRFYKPKIKKFIAISESKPAHSSEYNFWDCFTEKTIRVINLLSPVAKDFSTTQLGIVCKKEFEFEKKTSIPLRLRIGSLDYTNYMERKPNALRPL